MAFPRDKIYFVLFLTHLLGHAHIDLSWLRRREETVADIATFTFKGILAQVDKLPGHDLRPGPGGHLRSDRKGPS